MLRLSERQESEIHALGLGLRSSNARLSLSGENVGIPNDCYVFQHVRVVCYEEKPEAHHLEFLLNLRKREGFYQCFEFSTILMWNNLRHDTVLLSWPLFQRALTDVRFP